MSIGFKKILGGKNRLFYFKSLEFGNLIFMKFSEFIENLYIFAYSKNEVNILSRTTVNTLLYMVSAYWNSRHFKRKDKSNVLFLFIR